MAICHLAIKHYSLLYFFYKYITETLYSNPYRVKNHKCKKKTFSKRGWYLSHNIYLSFAVWSIQRFGSWAINILIFICNTIRKTFSVFWDKLKTLIWLDNLCQQEPLEPGSHSLLLTLGPSHLTKRFLSKFTFPTYSESL